MMKTSAQLEVTAEKRSTRMYSFISFFSVNKREEEEEEENKNKANGYSKTEDPPNISF